MSGAQGCRAREANSRWLKFGVIGTVILTLCCFTPLLVVLLGTVGLAAMLGWLDYVLLPALAAFIGITVYALWRRGKLQQERP